MTSEVNSQDDKECQKSNLNQRGARQRNDRMVSYGFRTMHPWVKNFGVDSQRNLWQNKDACAICRRINRQRRKTETDYKSSSFCSSSAQKASHGRPSCAHASPHGNQALFFQGGARKNNESSGKVVHLCFLRKITFSPFSTAFMASSL